MKKKTPPAIVKSVSTYANAMGVLPAELVESIQQHHTGVLYVPSISSYHDKRRGLVLMLAKRGLSNLEIGRIAGISPRRVRQIVQETRVAKRGLRHE